MSHFRQGDTVRTKGGGPIMIVDAFTPSGEVVCTYWVKDKRHQENFVHATLEPISPEQIRPKVGISWLGSERQ